MLPDVDELPSPRRRRAIAACGAIAGGIALWWLLSIVLSPDRGIDLTDEGLYLLAADPPSTSAAWVVPWGWHTRPLFWLVGHDLATLRTLAVWLLVVACAVLGWVVGHVLVTDDGVHRRAARWACALVGAVGAPMLMASLLRTPGYNWVNLFGLVVGGIASLSLLVVDPATLQVRAVRTHVLAATIAFGAVFTVAAKPTSGPLLLVAALLLVGRHLGRTVALRFFGLTCLWGIVVVAGAVVVGVWPHDFLSVLIDATKFPTPASDQTITGAVSNLLHVPQTAWKAFWKLGAGAHWTLLVAFASALALHFSRRAGWALRLTPLLLLAVTTIGITVPWHGFGGAHPKGRYAWVGTINAAMFLVIGVGLFLLAQPRGITSSLHRRALAVAAFLVALAGIFAFGSAQGVYRQSGLAACLLWLAAAAFIHSVPGARPRLAALSVLAVTVTTILAITIADSRNHPYRGEAMSAQTEHVELGARDVGLLLDPATATFLQQMEKGAVDAGWCDGTPLLGTVFRWSSTVPYALGARVPDTLMVTLFGYSGSVAIADYTLSRLQPAQWAGAWILTSDPALLKRSDARSVRHVLDLLPVHLDRTFPDDYLLAIDVDGTQLWKPRDFAGCGGQAP